MPQSTPSRVRRASAPWCRPRTATLAATLAAVGAMTLTGCGGSTSVAAAPPNASSAPAASGAPGASGASGRANGGAAPGAFGVIAELSTNSMEVQNPSNGQTTVSWSGTTAFTQTKKVDRSAITVGSCVSAVSAQSATASSGSTPNSRPTGPVSFTAATVDVVPARGGSCGFGGANPPSGAAFPTGSPRTRPSTFPSGARSGGFAGSERATGTVASLSGSTLTVKAERSGSTVTDTITLDPATVVTANVAAASSDLKQGECVSAFGKADDTGAVAATRIAISQPDPSGQCTSGFGGFGGFGRRGAGSAGTGTGSTSG